MVATTVIYRNSSACYSEDNSLRPLGTGHYLWQGWGPKRKWWGNWKIILALGGVAKKSLHAEGKKKITIL